MLPSVISYHITQKHIFESDVGMMIDRDVAEKGLKKGRDVKLLSFKHTLATDIIQCPTQ